MGDTIQPLTNGKHRAVLKYKPFTLGWGGSLIRPWVYCERAFFVHCSLWPLRPSAKDSSSFIVLFDTSLIATGEETLLVAIQLCSPPLALGRYRTKGGFKFQIVKGSQDFIGNMFSLKTYEASNVFVSVTCTCKISYPKLFSRYCSQTYFIS